MHNGTAAMLALELKWRLGGDRWAFQVSMRFFLMSARRCTVRRAYARACRILYCAHKKAATLALKLKWRLSGDRLDFLVNMGFSDVSQAVHRTARVRARAWRDYE